MIIAINFKNYVYGKKALDLAKKIKKYLPKAIVCVPALDLKDIANKTKLQVFAQYVDHSNTGTGHITPKAVKIAGGKGTLINHFEHKENYKIFNLVLGDLEEAKLRTIACASAVWEAKILAKYKPWAIAYEDPELIGTGKSVTKYNPKSIKEFVKNLKGTKIIPLCGAGINSKEDVMEAKKLGCKGVLIASAIANSKNPEKILREISKVK